MGKNCLTEEEQEEGEERGRAEIRASIFLRGVSSSLFNDKGPSAQL